MLVAYVNDHAELKHGTMLGAFLSRSAAIALRRVSGDLLFQDSGEIDQEQDWLWEWEKNDPNCYARKAQAKALNIKDYQLVPISCAPTIR